MTTFARLCPDQLDLPRLYIPESPAESESRFWESESTGQFARHHVRDSANFVDSLYCGKASTLTKC